MVALQYYGNNTMVTLQEYNISVRHVYGNNLVGYQSVGYSRPICFYMATQSTTLALIVEDYTFLIHNSNSLLFNLCPLRTGNICGISFAWFLVSIFRVRFFC